MKIVLASPHFPPRYIGGVEVYVKRLADGFLELGDEPAVIAVEFIDGGPGGPRIDVDSSAGYPVYRLSIDLAHEKHSLGFHYGAPPVDRAIEHILATLKPDVVHLHSGYLLGCRWLASAKAAGASTLLTLHDYWSICPRITMTHPDGGVCSGADSAVKCAWCLATERRRFRTLDTVSNGAVRRTLPRLEFIPGLSSILSVAPGVSAVRARRRAQVDHLSAIDVINAPSQFVRDQVAAAGFPRQRMSVVRNSVVSHIVRRAPSAFGAVRRFGYLGQVAPHKGVHTLIDAVRRLPSAPLTLTIHGDLTRSAEYVVDLRARAGGDSRIVFAGAYTSDRINDVLSALDVLVVPSIWNENAPFVILEAQRAGLPVVASRLGGMPELVSDERDGLLARAGDAEDLARQLERLLDPALVCALAAAAPDVRTFDEELHELRNRYSELRKACINQSQTRIQTDVRDSR